MGSATAWSGNTVCSLIRENGRLALDIRVISSLTPEDEARYATAFLTIITAMLDSVPTTYAAHVQLADGTVVRSSESTAHDSQPAVNVMPVRAAQITSRR